MLRANGASLEPTLCARWPSASTAHWPRTALRVPRPRARARPHDSCPVTCVSAEVGERSRCLAAAILDGVMGGLRWRAGSRAHGLSFSRTEGIRIVQPHSSRPPELCDRTMRPNYASPVTTDTLPAARAQAHSVLPFEDQGCLAPPRRPGRRVCGKLRLTHAVTPVGPTVTR